VGGTSGRYQWEVPVGGTSGRYQWEVPVGGTSGRYQWEVLVLGEMTVLHVFQYSCVPPLFGASPARGGVPSPAGR